MSKLYLTRILKAGAVASVLGLSALAAQAQGPHEGPHGGRGGPGGPGMMMGGGHIEHMLESADATEAQRAQIKKIMEAARADLKTQHESGRKLHEQGLTLLAAPTIDAAAIENVRQQAQAQREVASKRMSQALIEAARVLTPEQRAKLAEKMKKRQARMAERGAEHTKDRAAKRGN